MVQDAHELGGDIAEVDFQVDFQFWNQVFSGEMFLDIFLETTTELINFIRFHGESRGIFMASEVFQQIRAMVDGIVDIEVLDGSGRASDKVVGSRQDDGWSIIVIGQTRGHDTDDTFVPVLIKDDGASGIEQFFVVSNHIKSFFGDAIVEFTTGVIEFVDIGGQFQGVFVFFGKEEADRVGCFIDAACCIDTGADKEHEVANGQLTSKHVGIIAIDTFRIFFTSVDVSLFSCFSP